MHNLGRNGLFPPVDPATERDCYWTGVHTHRLLDVLLTSKRFLRVRSFALLEGRIAGNVVNKVCQNDVCKKPPRKAVRSKQLLRSSVRFAISPVAYQPPLARETLGLQWICISPGAPRILRAAYRLAMR